MPDRFYRIKKAIDATYQHWPSSMRAEMLQRIAQLEKDIEAERGYRETTVEDE